MTGTYQKSGSISFFWSTSLCASPLNALNNPSMYFSGSPMASIRTSYANCPSGVSSSEILRTANAICGAANASSATHINSLSTTLSSSISSSKLYVRYDLVAKNAPISFRSSVSESLSASLRVVSSTSKVTFVRGRMNEDLLMVSLKVEEARWNGSHGVDIRFLCHARRARSFGMETVSECGLRNVSRMVVSGLQCQPNSLWGMAHHRKSSLVRGTASFTIVAGYGYSWMVVERGYRPSLSKSNK